jgi:hypothetical protein
MGLTFFFRSDVRVFMVSVKLWGVSSWVPGRWPQTGCCAGDYMVSYVVAVMVFLLGHVDGEEMAEGEPSAGGASVKAAPNSCCGGLVHN